MAHGSVLLFQRSADARALDCFEGDADADDDDDDGDDDAHPPTSVTITNIAVATRAAIM